MIITKLPPATMKPREGSCPHCETEVIIGAEDIEYRESYDDASYGVACPHCKYFSLISDHKIPYPVRMAARERWRERRSQRMHGIARMAFVTILVVALVILSVWETFHGV